MIDVHSPILKTIPSLDGIRAISVLIVVVSHAGLGEVVPGGLGVTVFFFLSGYLITTLMLTENESTGRINILNFYARRVFRLMPPLFVTLAIAYGLTYFGFLPGSITAKGLSAQIFYFANYYSIFFDTGNTVPEGTGILWSLAVEEHFYIFYPLFMTVLLAGGVRPRTIAMLLGVGCLVILAWRIYLVQSPDFVPYRTYYASDARIDSIIYGCILALVINPTRDLNKADVMSPMQWALLVVSFGALLLTLLYRNNAFRETLRYSFQGLALIPLFYIAIRFHNNPLFRPLNSSWAVKLGVYSYAIYLIHHVVINGIAARLPPAAAKFFIIFPVALLISIAYAIGIDRLIDPYFRNLRQKFRSALASKTIGSG